MCERILARVGVRACVSRFVASKRLTKLRLPTMRMKPTANVGAVAKALREMT